MTFVVADRVQENGSVATGTGSVTLAGAVDGYQSFASGIGNNNTTYYTIYDPVAYTWEVGLGTVTTGPNTLARTTVYANSAGTQPSKISFSTTNTLTVFVTYPAEIAIYTGATASLNSVTTTKSITGSTNQAPYNYGTLTYSDTNIFTSYQTSVNSYAQMILQNSSTGTAASADYVVSSDGGTSSTNYGNFGINSSFFTGTGPLNSPAMVYLYSQSTDLTIGTNTSNAIHFTINNQATDAMTINTASAVAFNGQYGSLGQVLISQGSSTPPSWGNAGGNLVTVDFTATSGQTTFTTPYVVGTVSVYRNGVKLGIADFTATNGSTVVLASGAVTGDLIEIQSFTTLTLYSSITSQNFSGTGSQTVFTMNSNPANSSSALVVINGVTQDPSNYTVSGTTLTFSTAPAAGTNNISVRYLGVPSTTSVSSFSAGTTGFSPTTASSGAVVLSGTLVVANGGTGLTTLATGRIPYGAGTAALNSASTFTFDGSTLFVPAASNAGNLTFTGTGARILGDFTNSTVTNRASFQTSTTNGSTGIYALPNGSSTAASWQATNAADPTNAAKVLIATNGSTDVQLVSGVNGSGTYLPLALYNGGLGRFVIGTSGQFGIGPTASVNYGLAGQVLTSQGPASPPTWTSVSVSTISYLIVAGGGGGGSCGGGGGAGGYLAGTTGVNGGVSYTVTVGGGGNAGSSGVAGAQGSSSSAFSLTAIGGGSGQGNNSAGGNSGGSGGGGGSAGGSGGGAGGAGTSGQGNAGGSGNAGSANYGAGGGGGASAVGAAGTNSAGGNGGAGTASTITGSSVTYAGGGGGGIQNSATAGTGGAGGGGAGTGSSTTATSGTANTGGGGGGSGYTTGFVNGGSGGSGIVVVSYPTSYKLAIATGTYTQTSSGGNYIFTFTGSGTITF